MTTTTSNSGSVKFTVNDEVINKSIYLSGYDFDRVKRTDSLDHNRPRSVEEDESDE